MTDGFSVRTDELAQCGRRVSSMSSQAGSLRDRATTAEVPSRSWGLLGELTTHSEYADLRNQLTDHLSAMTTGLDNAGQRISNTADLYRETDEYHRKRMAEHGPDSGERPRKPGGLPAPNRVPSPPDPGMVPDPSLTPGGHGKITVEVKGDIQRGAGHAKIALRDQYEHMSGTLPITEDAQ
jgi:uncharacterized protein YukE